MSVDEDDASLVRQIQRGGTLVGAAYETLVRRHESHVRANCRYLAGRADEADDLAQEVFVKAFFALPRFEGRASFRTWIQRIKVNHCLNHLERRRARVFVDVEDPVVEQEPQVQVAPDAEVERHRADTRRAIVQVLEAMNDTLRAPLVMRDVDGLPYAEIADALGIGLSAVKMRIKRARAEFRERYETLEREASVAAEGEP